MNDFGVLDPSRRLRRQVRTVPYSTVDVRQFFRREERSDERRRTATDNFHERVLAHDTTRWNYCISWLGTTAKEV